MKVGYEIDRVKLYNFMKKNDINQKELSTMLGKSQSYISQIMTGRQNMSDDALEKLADLMEINEEDLLARPGTPYSNVEHRPTFEERMETLIMTDDERRKRFFGSQAFQDEMKRQRELYQQSEGITENQQETENTVDVVEPNEEDNGLRARIEELTKFLSQSIINGKKYIGTMELVNILLS